MLGDAVSSHLPIEASASVRQPATLVWAQHSRRLRPTSSHPSCMRATLEQRGSNPPQLRALAPLLPLLPRLLLCACWPLAGWLEHRPLDGSDALLEARRASPREARRGCESGGQRRLGQARLRVVEEGGAEAARQQLAAHLAHLALPRGGRVAGVYVFSRLCFVRCVVASSSHIVISSSRLGKVCVGLAVSTECSA